MKRILLSLSLAALIGVTSLGIADDMGKPKAMEVSKPAASMDRPNRQVTVTFEGPGVSSKETRFIQIGGREIEVTGKRMVSVELTPNQIESLRSKRLALGKKGFIRDCQNGVTFVKADKPSSTEAAHVIVTLGMKNENGKETLTCDHALVKWYSSEKLIGTKPKP